MKIRSKLALAFIALSIPFMVATNIFFYVSEKNTLTHNILNHLESVASIQQHRIGGIAEQNLERLKLVASRTQLRISLEQFLADNDKRHQLKMNKILADAQASLVDFKNICVYSPGGEVVASNDPSRIGGKPQHEDFFDSGREGNKVDLFHLDSDQNLSLYLTGPLYLENKFLGVLLIETKIDNMVSAISDYTGLEQTGETILASKNQNGDTVFIMPTRFDRQAALRLIISANDSQIPINQAFSGEGELLTDATDYRNISVLAATRHIKDMDWGIVVKVDKQEAFAPLAKMKARLFAILGGTICFILFLSLYLAKSITRPIVRLTRVAHKISEDNFEEQADESHQDEIGVLAVTFNQMTKTLINTRKILERNINELQGILDNSSTVIYIKDIQGKYILINHQYEQIFNISKKEIVGKTDHDIFPKAAADALQANDLKALNSADTAIQIEEYVPQSDGLHTYISAKFKLNDLSGKPYAVCGISTDVSDWIKAKDQLQQSKEEWERTFNAINDIVSLQDTSMKIVKINQIGCDTLGLPCEDIIGRHCYELFHGTNEPCPECPLLVTQKTFKPYTKEMTHEKLGKTFLVSAAPVQDSLGKLTHIAHVAKDITERKKMEERLFLNEKLETIAGLAAGVAHEINTPLSAILQSQQMMEMRLSPDTPRNREIATVCGIDLGKVATYFKQREIDVFMKGMRESAINAANIIKNLLEFSRPHEGDIIPADLPKLLDNSLQLARSDYDLKKQYDIINVDIRKKFDPDLTEVPCVPMEIEQVILNLIKNAVHAMCDNNTENPCITVRTVKTEKMARIEIKDNGPGMDEEIIRHIFDPFFTTKEVGLGTGLGLSVSHAIIHDKHKGNIWVESEPGKGAKFIVELPLS